MQTYLAIRLRTRAVRVESHAIQERVGKRAFLVGVVLAMLCVAISVALGGRGMRLVASVVNGLLVGFLFLPASHFFGFLLLGPIVARRRNVPRVGVDEMLESAKAIGFSDLPPQDEPVFLPDAPRLEVSAERSLEQRDVWIFAANAALPTVVMAVTGMVLGLSGLAAALGLEMASHGLLALRHRAPRLVLLRSRLVPDLVAAEPVSVDAACPLISPPMAWLRLLAGSALAVFSVVNVVQHKSAPLPPVFTFMWLVAAVGIGALATRTAKKRHAARRVALAKAGKAS
jgi:hypothetical protein